MKKLIYLLLPILVFVFAFSIGKTSINNTKVQAYSDGVYGETNSNSNQERFIRVPEGTSVVDLNSGVWNNMPEFPANNVLTGINSRETTCVYKLMWNDTKLFFYIKTYDTSWNDDDLIEIGFKYKDQNWGYLFATLAPWVADTGFGNGGMTFVDFKKNTSKKERTIVFAVNFTDTSMLKKGETFLINVNYYDYGARVNNNKKLNCRLQSGCLASGDASMLVGLSGYITEGITETADYTINDYVLSLYGSDEDNKEEPKDEPKQDETKAGCSSNVEMHFINMVLIMFILSIMCIKKEKRRNY